MSAPTIRPNANRILDIGLADALPTFEALNDLETAVQKAQDTADTALETSGDGTAAVGVEQFELGAPGLIVPAPAADYLLYVVSIKVTSSNPGPLVWNPIYEILGSFQIDETLNSYAVLTFVLINGKYRRCGLGLNGAL